MPFMALFAPALVAAWLGTGPAQAQVAPLMLWLTLGLHAHMLTGPATAVARGRGNLALDFEYHGLRLLTLALATAACLHGPGPVQLLELAQALCLAQCIAALVFLARAHWQLQGSWAGVLRQLLAPSLLAYALAGALQRWLTPLLDAAQGRIDVLLGLGMALGLWLILMLALLAGLLLTRQERRSLARRCLPARAWRLI